MKQIEKMRELYHRFSGDEARTVEDYARAEERGEVARDSNTYGYSSQQYAKRLFYNTFKRKS